MTYICAKLIQQRAPEVSEEYFYSLVHDRSQWPRPAHATVTGFGKSLPVRHE